MLEIFLCASPKAGASDKGTGGLRKLRWQLEHTGKRGGVRVIYVDFERYEKIYLISAYNKRDKDDLSESEKKSIKRLISQLEDELRRKQGQ